MICNKCINKSECYDGNHELTRYGCEQNDWVCFAPVTNGDRIRAMTDDELADYACSFGFCVPNFFDISCREKANCKVCWIDWLKQEAKK